MRGAFLQLLCKKEQPHTVHTSTVNLRPFQPLRQVFWCILCTKFLGNYKAKKSFTSVIEDTSFIKLCTLFLYTASLRMSESDGCAGGRKGCIIRVRVLRVQQRVCVVWWHNVSMFPACCHTEVRC